MDGDNREQSRRQACRYAHGHAPWAPLAVAAAVLAVLSALLAPVPAMAAWQSSMVIDANTGDVLHAEDADEPRHPASLTKMMTLYIVFEMVERGVLSFSTPIRMTESAADKPPSKLGLDAGETIRLGDAVKALITKSANDVAAAVADHISGSERNFARLMTQTARRLGMSSTTFRNASGLTDEGQVTTARDMLTLALRLNDEFPQHYRLFATRSFSFGGRSYSNHNGLLRSFQGTDGIKTGYTRASGFNIVTSVRRGRRHVVGVVFGGASARQRDAKMRVLLTRTLAKASPTRSRRRPEAPLLVARPKIAPRPARVTAAAPANAWTVNITPPAPRLVQQAAPRDIALDNGWRAQAAPSTIGDLISHHVARSPVVQQTSVPPAGLGRQPSTLEAQAAQIAGAANTGWQTAPSPAIAEGPAITSSSHQIQVGAYRSQREAERQIASVRERASGLLAAFQPLTMPVASGGSALYRARFAGFDASSAAITCTELRRRGIDCHVARAQ